MGVEVDIEGGMGSKLILRVVCGGLRWILRVVWGRGGY